MSMVVALLFGLQDVAAAVEKFHAIYKDAGPDEKVAAIRELAHCKHSLVLEALSPLLTEGAVETRIVTARELGAFGGVSGTSRKLVEAFNRRCNQQSKADGVRITILRSLGELRAVEATDLVNRHIEDRQEWIAKAAIDAAGRLRQKSSIEPLLKEYGWVESKRGNQELGVDPLEGAVVTSSTDPIDVIRGHSPKPKEEKPKTCRELLRPAIEAALTSITRRDLAGLQTWGEWWTRNQAHFQVPQ